MSFRSNTHSFTSHVFRAAALFAALAIGPASHAVTLYWDQDSTLGGNGTWDVNTTQNWSTVNAAGAPDSKWTPNDGTLDAAFNGPGTASYTVTIPAGTTINANSISMGITATTVARNVIITGGTVINLTSPTSSIVMNTQRTTATASAQVIKSPISGTTITVVADHASTDKANARLDLGDASLGTVNTFTGDLIFGGTGSGFPAFFSQIDINSPGALPSTATVRMKRDNSQLLFTAGGAAGTTAYTATFNNNIILNDGVSVAAASGLATQSIGSANNGSVITLGGVISGNANLLFRVGAGGGQGTLVLANHETYTGSTTLTVAATNGSVRLGIDNALPQTTTLIANVGIFNMNGFNQKIAGLNSTAPGTALSIINTSATTSTLTIDGNVTGTFGVSTSTVGRIGGGIPTAPVNNKIALVLGSTNTGTLTLANGEGNTYDQGTTISGGKLVAANDITGGGSATGSGPVAVNSGGTLGGGGSAGWATTGAITVNSGGHIAPGASIGTLTVNGALSLGSGSRLDMELGAPVFGASGTSDRIDLPNTFGSFPLTVPAAANSIGVNLGDAAGGAAGNGTYTLISFQAGQYTGSTNASQYFTSGLPSPNSLNGATIVYHLADNTNTIQEGANAVNATRVIAIVSGGSNALTWTGGAGNGNWDVGITSNFNSATTGASSTFANNDNVTFDDTGANTDPITIAAGGVQPNIVTINNSGPTYTISGGDIKGSSLGGGGGLYFGGTGAATINSNYTAVGPIVSNKSGSGAATINGNITAATSLTVNGGTLTLAGANTYTASNTINGGTLSVGADNNLGATANSIVIAGGTLKSTATFTLNTSRSITTSANASTISPDPSTTLTYGGVISGTGGLTQSGGGTSVLSGANTYSGNTTVTNGNLVVSGASARLGGGNVTVSGTNANTFLTISSGVTDAILDTKTLLLAGGGTAGVADQGYIDLGAGVNEHVAALLLGTPAVTQAFGTYGSTASSATFKNDEYFAGMGIVTLTIPGDYNGDFKVDAADYVSLRKQYGSISSDPGSTAYNTWRTNFGRTASGSGSALGAGAIPEPAALLLAAIGVLAVSALRRGRR